MVEYLFARVLREDTLENSEIGYSQLPAEEIDD